MIAFDLAYRALIALGAAVEVHEAEVVTAEQTLGLIDVISTAAGVDMSRPAKEVAKDIRRAAVREIVFQNVIFAAISSTRGSRAGTRPFVEFLQEAGFTTPFMCTSKGVSRPAYRTANWQFLLRYDNVIGVGNIGEVSLIELDSKRKTAGVTARSIRKLLSQYAENVPNERGVTKAQKQLGHAPAKVATSVETEDVIPESFVTNAEKLDLAKAQGQHFRSFQDLANRLL